MAFILKGHYTGCYADTTLAFYLHKVAGGMFLYFVAFYCACSLYGAAKEQELFRKGSLTGIGVRDDGKGFAFVYFVDILHGH